MNWIELKALHDLYIDREKKNNQTLIESFEINFLANSLGIIEISARKLIALPGYREEYEDKYLEKFNVYEDFLRSLNLLKSQTRFDEEDIKTLIKVYKLKNAGRLDDLRKQIIEFDESVRGVSQMFFKNEKYLDNKSSLVDALKKVLEVEHFSNEKDQQYIYKLECAAPKAIVLCENLNFLTRPNKPRQYNIELWYAGGKNITKLDYADTRGLPIYYSGDWDYDGIFIIYPLVKAKIPSIELLTPTGPAKGIKETEHSSKWKKDEKQFDFALNTSQHDILKTLINEDQWIIEESNNLIEMINGVNPILIAK